MRNKVFDFLCVLFLGLGLSGCVVRAYSVQKDRIDQNITGNRGYIKGTVPQTETKVKPKRNTYVVELELGAPKVSPLPAEPTQETPIEGNVVNESEKLQSETIIPQIEPVVVGSQATEVKPVSSATQYKIEQGDTLQKISKKFYGSYSKWTKIYDANKDKIKNPNAIVPGHTLIIPQE